MPYALLADLIVAIHIAYVVYVVGGLVAILMGAWRGRTWIRNPWFRITHLVAILATFFLAPPRWKNAGKKLAVDERG
jgi:hypothetical protein